MFYPSVIYLNHVLSPKTVHIDCGYDTGHMEIDVNADSN